MRLRAIYGDPDLLETIIEVIEEHDDEPDETTPVVIEEEE